MTRRRIAVLLALGLVVGIAVLLVESEDVSRTERAAAGSAPAELAASVAGPVVRSIVPVPNGVATEPLEARDWLRSRQESADDFALAEELAAAALQGDARAHYVLGELLLRCEVSKRTLAPYQDGSVAERMERYIADNAIALEHSRQALRAEAARCARLFSADPFAQFELPPEARDFRYWAKRAVELGDPIAVMDRTLRLAAGRGVSDDNGSEQELRQALLDDVRAAVDSREPAALFLVGTLFSQPAITTSSDVGLAWHVAACEAGYDCSNSNPDFGFGCIQAGTCVAGLTYVDIIQRDLGAAPLPQIYAVAQVVECWGGVEEWGG
jgi:hypothetical protein